MRCSRAALGQDAGVDADGWLDLLGLEPEEVPRLLVLEGTWWRAEALEKRLPALTDVRELGAPDLWHGWHGDVPVVYCPAYGASRAVEPVHIFGVCGTRTVVQIGSCGGLQPGVHTGDIVLPESATIGEGASQYYGGTKVAQANLGRVARAAALLATTGIHTHRGPTFTTSALLQQPESLVRTWAAAGHLGVDMETSAVFSAAAHFGMRAAALLFVWDELPFRSWADDFTDAERAAQDRASETVYEVALGLA
jgi:purine-nucleoside phosphorylase